MNLHEWLPPLTGRKLLALALGAAVMLIGTIVVGWTRGRRAATPRRWWRVLASASWRLGVVLLALVMTLGSVFLIANRHFGFYSNWRDVFGIPAEVEVSSVPDPSASAGASATPARPIRRVAISHNNPHPRGLEQVISVPGAEAPYDKVLVWLPPAHFEKSEQHVKFPVLHFISYYHGSGADVAKLLNAINLNNDVIASGKASPFIAVYSPALLRNGIDSECTDIPGADNLTHLVDRIPAAIKSKFRAATSGRDWYVGGWSTGGFCTANIMFRHPDRYHAGISIAPYFHPIYDDAQIAASRPKLVTDNSPLRMVRDGHIKRSRLLVMMSKLDPVSWGTDRNPASEPQGPDGMQFYEASKKIPGMTFMLMEQGGHNAQTYIAHMPAAMAWLGEQGL